jgi:hypothetical protein
MKDPLNEAKKFKGNELSKLLLVETPEKKAALESKE